MAEASKTSNGTTKKHNVTVVARIRPAAAALGANEDVVAPCVLVSGQRSVAVSRMTYGEIDEGEEKRQFSYDAVFGPETQQEVMFGSFKALILRALEGLNGTIFAYGQTGSGKTHTMFGPMSGGGSKSRGLVPRAIACIFRERPAAAKVRCTYCEVYDESLYDLLDGNHTSKNPQDWSKVVIQEDETGCLHFDGLSYYETRTAEDALALVFLGNSRRQVGASRANDVSSRSHSVFTLYVEHNGFLSKLHFVDLAGSERFDVVHEAQQRADPVAPPPPANKKKKYNDRESRHINLSLHYLEQVIVALHGGSDHRRHVPYRNSILTSMLRDSLGGNCRTAFIATLSPLPTHLGETTWEEASPAELDDEVENLRQKLRLARTQVADRDGRIRALEAEAAASKGALETLRRDLAASHDALEATEEELSKARVSSPQHSPTTAAFEPTYTDPVKLFEAVLESEAALDDAKLRVPALRRIARRLRKELLDERSRRNVTRRFSAPSPSRPSSNSNLAMEMSALAFVDDIFGSDGEDAQEPDAKNEEPPAPYPSPPVPAEDPSKKHRDLLSKGSAALKQSRRGIRDLKYVWVDVDRNVSWRRIGADSDVAESCIPLRDFQACDRGGPKGVKDVALLNRGLTLAGAGPTLTLQFDAGTFQESTQLRDAWLKAFQFELAHPGGNALPSKGGDPHR